MTTPARADWSTLTLIAVCGVGALVVAALFVPDIRGVLVALVVAAIYFVPTILAGVMNHRQVAAITVLNLFAGWTIIGWVGALVWAFVQPAPTS